MWLKNRKNKKHIAGETNSIRSDKKSPSRIKSTLLLLLMFASLITALPIFQSTNAGAVKKQADMSFSEQIKSHIYLYSIARCMKEAILVDHASYIIPGLGTDLISKPHSESGEWFQSGGTVAETYVGPYMNDVISGVTDGKADCGAAELISGAWALWGLTSTEILCNSGFVLQDTMNTDGSIPPISVCMGGGGSTGSYLLPDELAKNGKDKEAISADLFMAYIISQIGNTDLSPAQEYWYYRHTLNNSCIPGIDTKPPVAEVNNTDFGYNQIQWVDLSSDKFDILQDPKEKSSYTGTILPGDKVKLRVDSNLSNADVKCSTIVDEMNKNAKAFQAWAIENPLLAAALLAELSGGDKSTTTCAINGVGWIICPVVNFMAMIADASYGYLEKSFLVVEPELFKNDSATYEAWGIMRNFANVAFVIAFLIIIFSQLTGAGITNYGVKKMLPRLIIAAILVNLSYFICQIGVDLSNIIGKSLADMFINMGTQLAQGEQATGFWNGGSWVSIAGGILATAVVGAAIWASLSALIPVLIMAVFALVMILFILTARQALIVLLVVISPLAFVAYLLPNTEKWYKSWQKMFVGLLMLYPIVGLVYGVSGFASNILSGVMKGTLGEIAAASVVVLPLFLIPVILKKSLDGVGNIGSTLNNIGKKGGKFTSDKLMGSDYSKHLQDQKASRVARQKTGNYKGKGRWMNPGNLRSGLNRKLNRSSTFNKMTGGYGASRVVTGQGQDVKDTSEAKSLFRNNSSIAMAWGADKGELGDAYERLSEHDQEQYRLLRDSGQHKKYTSFLAAAESMYESGKGSPEEFQNALDQAEAVGAQASDISTVKGLAVSGYRKNGRAEMAGTINHSLLEEYDANATKYNLAHQDEINAGTLQPMDYKNYNSATGNAFTINEQIAVEAASMAPSSVHREELGFDSLGNPTAGRQAFINNLELKRDNTRKAIAGYDSMEGRAKGKAEPLIIAAAAQHEQQSKYDEEMASGDAVRIANAVETAANHMATIDSMSKAREAFKFTNT